MDCRNALLTVLDQVDYTSGACRPNEMVGAVLPKEVIVLARKAIDEADKIFAEGLKKEHQVRAEVKKGVYCKRCELLVEYGDMKPWRKDDETTDMLCCGCDSVLVEGE